MLKNRLLHYLTVLICLTIMTSCGHPEGIPVRPQDIDTLTFAERVPLLYADQFAIDRYEGGYSMIYTADGASYLIVPEDKEVPSKLDGNTRVIKRPAENIYLAATAAMGLFDALGEGGAVKFSGAKAEDWYIDYAKNALQNGDMLYAGKYREPDYELLLSNGCELSIQSTMIRHSPDVREKLEELGITVFVDFSSYESHPLGRSEWIKVYGEMLDRQEKAEILFNEQADRLQSLTVSDSGKTAVFFYINNSGQAVTRKSGDYVTKMIELAGGENAFKNLGTDNASSSVTMETEDFYSAAKDADFIIYNSTIGGEIQSVSDLISKSSLLSDFKAVKNGNVWCTRNNLFQETMKIGSVIADFNAVFSDDTENRPPQFLYKSEGGEKVE